jgi:hypothetical protein
VVWDGSRSTFPRFQKLIDGHLLQVGAGYIASEVFLSRYKELGPEYLASSEFKELFGIPTYQALWDRKYMYGILKSTTRGFEDASTNFYAPTQDGFAVWHSLRANYGHGISKDVRVEMLEEQLTTKFNPGSNKSLMDYIDSYERIATQLTSINPSEWSSLRKIKLLHRNVHSAGPSFKHVLQTIKDKRNIWNFTEVIQYMRDAAWDYDRDRKILPPSKAFFSHRIPRSASQDDSDSEGDIDPFQNVKTPDLSETACINLVKGLIDESGIQKAYSVLQVNSVRESLHIPHAIWVKLEPKLKEKIEDIKRQIRQESGKTNYPKEQNSNFNSSNSPKYNPTSPSNSPKPVSAKLPPQYSTSTSAHHTLTESESVSALNEMLNSINFATFYPESDDETSNFHCYTVNAIIQPSPTQDIEVKANLEYLEQLKPTQSIYAITDGGADCCITGLNARVVHYTGRNATLVGYDPATTKSYNTPIVTADLKVKAHNGIPVILRIHETPYNHGSPVTLLSEYQIREFGLIVDSVAAKH